ncbi:hypothetical protein SAMN04487770_12313 [Butyrivibrio sp. ob235]|uniref:hypothetical protein n=1 Tax=Butyrivibrio sp. ob235 TaxID=1761780 RepID=UPI0008B0F566|nr:hypothetical protein [Butyrivibrio sp. ob235]SEM00126.1 hypothetical protein SAMN04487770_12313 [Butyrivibrio sp. ob235]
MTLIKKLKEKKDVALATAYVGCTYAMTSTCYAAGTDLDIKTVITNALNLVFGVLVFGGVIGAITGIRGIAKGVQDDGSGPDSQAVSKGKGQLIAGIIMMAPVPVFKVLTGQTPSTFVGSFF